MLNSSINITSPVVRKVQIDITKSPIENITVDLGDDGLIDFTFLGPLNSTTSPAFVELNPRANQFNTIKISSVTSGIIQVNKFKMNATINPVVLNHAEFEDCSNCTIDFAFGGNSLTVDGLNFDFLGSWNYTATARWDNLSDTRIVQIYYSDFNYSIPENVYYYNVLPTTNSSKNISPEGQTINNPFWNFTNNAYDEKIDIYVKTSEPLETCMNSTWTNNSNRSNPLNLNVVLNTSYQKILSNVSINFDNPGATGIGVWNWWDLYSCPSGLYIPFFNFSSVCSDCYFDETQLDNYNILVG